MRIAMDIQTERRHLSRETPNELVMSMLEASRRGIVVGYTVRLAEEMSRRLVKAYVSIIVAPKAAAAVGKALQRMPEVRALHSVSGLSDLLVMVEAEDVPLLDAALDRIGAVEGVERTQSSIVLSTKFER